MLPERVVHRPKCGYVRQLRGIMGQKPELQPVKAMACCQRAWYVDLNVSTYADFGAEAKAPAR